MINIKILTQNNSGMKGYHGTLGTETNMYDSFGEPLFIGDIVITSNQDKFSKQHKYLGNEYGIMFVCEENTEIANWTGKNQQYIMGVADIWNSKVFDANPIDFDSDYWDDLLESKDGWIIHKIKDWQDVVEGEKIGFLHVQEV